MNRYITRPLSYLLAIIILAGMFASAPVIANADTTDITDILTAADFTAASTTYTDFSNVSSGVNHSGIKSDAVYAGKSAKNSSGAIQLNGKNPYGVVTTASGGKVKSVKITVSSGTNTIDVYGKNSEYSDGSDLYSTSTQGSKIGSLSSTGTITVSGDYKYIGIRSNKNAIYLTSIEITWKTATTTHNVTWYDWDESTELYSDDFEEGTSPVYGGAEPTLDFGDGSHYVFSGWRNYITSVFYSKDTSLPDVYDDVFYVAEFAEVCEVTWDLDNGTNSVTEYVVKGQRPSYSGTPTKDSDNEHTYTFSGWQDLLSGDTYSAGTELPVVNDDVYYTAQYTASPRHYTVTWKNGDTTLKTDTDATYNSAPSYGGEAPTKQATAQYTYTFDGWTVEGGDSTVYATESLPAVTGDVTFVAHFAETTNTYTVTWKNGDDVLETDTGVAYGDTPSYDSATPSKPETDTYVYEFKGWTIEGSDTVYTSSNLPPIAGDTTFIAKLVQKSKFQRVDTLTADDFTATGTTYKAFSGVSSGESHSGITSDAVYAGQSAQNTNGSIQIRSTSPSGIVTTVSGGRVSKIKVTWDSTTSNGRELNIYGKGTAYNPENWYGSPGEKIGTIKYGEGESTEVEIDGNYEYIGLRSNSSALYLSKVEITWDTTPPQNPVVTWMNGDTEIYHETITYNTSPVYDYANRGTPSKPDDDHHYTFSGWTNGTKEYSLNDSLPAAKSDVIYTAKFDSTPIYKINWNNWNGTPIESDTFYGDPVKPSFDSSNPAKADNSYYSYTFLGWKDSSGNRYYNVSNIPEVSGNETFTAIYNATPKYKSGRIVSTTDSATTYNVGGKYYITGGEKKIFSDDAVFTDNYDSNGTFSLGDAVVNVTPPTEGAFAHTVYVTGEGTEDDPFEFFPNFIYSANTAKIADAKGTERSKIHPGDGFRGNSKIKVLDAYIRFLQYEDQPDLECAHGTNGYMGIGATKYGNRYNNENALPYSFVLGGNTIYFLGELNNALNFSEELELDNELGAVTPTFTVTWANYDGTTIRTNQVFRGLRPSYGTIAGSTPEKPDDDDYRYTFCGWTDSQNNYEINDELPEVYGDITYTARYTQATLDIYTITWKNYNGNVLAETNCKDGKVPVYPNNNPSKPSDDEYIYTFAGWNDGSHDYPADSLPKITGNTEFTAYYTSSPIPAAPATYTVTWTDWDGSVLEIDYGVAEGSTPHFDGETPTRADDNKYSYTFRGWYPHKETVTYDITYKAQYAKTPHDPVGPIEDKEWIFSTDDGMTYILQNLYYKYHDEVLPFDNSDNNVFERDGDVIYLGGKAVADIGVELFDASYHAEFINSVYVSDCGSPDDPFVFHPNYLYYGTKNKISDGCVVALKEEYKQGTVKAKTVSYPGDQYKGNTIVKVGYTEKTQQVKFLDYSPTDELSVANYYVGVCSTTYGTHYTESTAYIGSTSGSPNYFSSEDKILYYHGEDDNNAFEFAESAPGYQSAFYKRVPYKEEDIFEDGNKEYFYYEDKNNEKHYYLYENGDYEAATEDNVVITKLVDQKLTVDPNELIASANPELWENNDKNYRGGRLLGFNKRLSNSDIEEEIVNENSGSLRFVSVLSSKILAKLNDPEHTDYDYGFVFAAVSLNGQANIENLTLTNPKAKIFSCRDTLNTLAGDYGDKEFGSTEYKYITAGINDIPKGIQFAARFYITYKGETHYITYPKNDSTGFVFKTSEYLV